MKGGGVAILINKQYSIEVIQIDNDDEKKDTILETVCIRTKPNRMPGGYGSCVTFCTYIPPDTEAKKNEAMANLIVFIDKVMNKIGTNNKVLLTIMGDFNKTDTSLLKRKYDCHIVSKKATRKGNLLDLIITNAPKCYHNYNQKPIGNADHDIVIAVPFENKPKKVRKKNTIINSKMIRTGKLEDTVEEIGSINWNLLIKSKDHTLQEKFNIFYDTIIEVLYTCQPKKRSKIRNDQPWMRK